MKKHTTVLFAALLFIAGAQAQVSFQSSDLPIVVINTFGVEIPDEPKIMANMGVIYNGPGQRNFLNNSFNAYSGAIGIELRGSTSQGLSDKKPYAVETRNADGSNLNVTLLGMPSENDWVFLAPFSDKSLLRDVLTYTLAGRIMPWAPRARFVEVMVNGDYKGVYAILESIKRDNNRVNIATLNPDENTGDDLTGGYILKIDKWTGSSNDGFRSNFAPPGNPAGEVVFQYHYPKPQDISGPQQAYIQQYMHTFEALMASTNYADPVSGYPSAIDVQSFVDFFLINEMTRNVDGYRLSTYLYKNKNSNGGKLKMGPVWDFNIALGNANYCLGGETTGWAADFNTVCPGDYWLIPFWWDRLRDDPAFLSAIRTRWQQLRTNTFSNSAIMGTIDSMAAVVQEAQGRNFQRWPILGQHVWPNNYVGGTYAAEVNYLKYWLGQRLIWLDGEIGAFPVLVNEPVPGDPLRVFPNPAANAETVVFEFFADGAQWVQLEIFDLTGRRVLMYPTTAVQGLNQIHWQSGGRNGLFIYQLTLNGRRQPPGKLVVR